MRKKIFFNISRTDSSSTRTLEINETTLKAFIGLIVVSVFVLVGISVFSIRNIIRINDLNMMKEENELLRNRLTKLSMDIDSINTKLLQFEVWEDQIRMDNELEEIPEELRKQGMGGIPQIDKTFDKFDEELSNKYNEIITSLKHSKAKIGFDSKTCLEMKKSLELKAEIFQNTPSIYPAFGKISDKYGWRTHPITGKRDFHPGLDIANKIGTPIYATADGEVLEVGRKKLFGRYIAIKHEYGYQTNYAHLHKILVKSGEKVEKGDVIALMGNTGLSTGAHLHYEVYRYHKHRNPYKYIDKQKDPVVITSK